MNALARTPTCPAGWAIPAAMPPASPLCKRGARGDLTVVASAAPAKSPSIPLFPRGKRSPLNQVNQENRA